MNGISIVQFIEMEWNNSATATAQQQQQQCATATAQQQQCAYGNRNTMLFQQLLISWLIE
jgi:hypothetical protein